MMFSRKRPVRHATHRACQQGYPFATAQCGVIINWNELDKISAKAERCIICQAHTNCTHCGVPVYDVATRRLC